MAGTTERHLARAGGAILALVLGVATMTTTGARAAGPDGGTVGGRDGDTRGAAAVARGTTPPPRDATIELRDLWASLDSLSPTARAQARDVLARPTDRGKDPYGDGYKTAEATPYCGPHVCIHYVTTTADKIPAADGDTDSVPDYVELALDTLEHVRDTYVAAGYRPPLPDGKRGGDGRIDVYLADVGDQGLYGYCTSDQPPTRRHDVWAYCVLDNDYRHGQFSQHTPQENLEVTAAHEFFHAVQFAYDAYEDGWFMEATATWAEDELYDDVDDNVQYLRYGQVGAPRTPLDAFTGLAPYGQWIFFRYLSEEYPAASGDLPTIVRAMWRRADASPGHRDEYSMQAVKGALAARHETFTHAYARFTAVNRFARGYYAEGAAERYPQTSGGTLLTLRAAHRSTGWLSRGLDHLTSAAITVVPRDLGAGAKAVVTVDMGDKAHAPVAIVDRVTVSGEHHLAQIRLSRTGAGSRTVAFSSAGTTKLVITLVDAGTSYRCGRFSDYSCGGTPKDDDQVAKVRVSLAG